MPTEPDTTQISAFISTQTAKALDRYVGPRGLKKTFVVEQAIEFHLRALRELPSDVIVPPRLTVDAATAETLMDRMKRPRKPTAALRALLRKK